MRFGSNGSHRKFTIWVHFGAQFTTRKPKVLLKTKICSKTTSLGISHNVSSRSQKNNKMLKTLIQRKRNKHFLNFGPKIGLNSHLGSHQGSSKILPEPIIRPFICTFWMPSYSFWVHAALIFTQKKQTLFWFTT